MKHPKTNMSGLLAAFGVDEYGEKRIRAKGEVLNFLVELDRRMKVQGVSRSELARRLGTNRSQVTRWFLADKGLNAETMWMLAEAVGFRLALDWKPELQSLYNPVTVEVTQPSADLMVTRTVTPDGITSVAA